MTTETAERRASDDIELVSSFVNTLEKNTTRPDEESLDSPEALRSWMSERGIPAGDALGPEDLGRAIEFRESIRLLLLSNNGGDLDGGALRRLRTAADAGLIRVEIEKDGQAFARPAEAGVSALFARLLAAVADIQCAGTWERLKACAADDCQWAFYDTSRNHSRTWCSMEVCGNRAKTRAYRARLSDG
jgi:predicted RNA-binding Zn ribbon-like protein